MISEVQVFLTSSVGACRMKVLLLDLLLLNQISNCSPLFPVDSVRPTSAVCRMSKELSESCRSKSVLQRVSTRSHLKGLFVDEDVQTAFHLLGFAEENKLLEEEDVALTLPPSGPDSELVLPDQLTLLFKVDLRGGKKDPSPNLFVPSPDAPRSTYVAVPDGVHRQQVITMAELELDHAGRSLQC